MMNNKKPYKKVIYDKFSLILIQGNELKTNLKINMRMYVTSRLWMV